MGSAQPSENERRRGERIEVEKVYYPPIRVTTGVPNPVSQTENRKYEIGNRK
jgi:hypothetical protein